MNMELEEIASDKKVFLIGGQNCFFEDNSRPEVKFGLLFYPQF